MSASLKITEAPYRTADHEIERLFIDRWSQRAFTGEPIPHSELLIAFEAARWAPSSLNYQPWRFIYAHRDSERFEVFLALLGEKNRAWAHQAGAIVFFVSETTIVYGDKVMASPSHAFDTGAAWANFAHQAMLRGYSTRAIGGFDRQAAPDALGVPANFDVHVAVAIGVPAPPTTLPESLRAKEFPSSRRPLTDFVFESRYSSPCETVPS